MNLRHTLVVVAAAVSVAGVVSAAEAYTARDYVQAALVGQFDGIENAGFGEHSATATTWVDLKGGLGNGTLKGDVTWGEKGWSNSTDGKPVTIGNAFAKLLNTSQSLTIEFVVTPSRTGTREVFLGNYQAGQNLSFEHNSGSFTDGTARFYFNSAPDMAADRAKIVADEIASIAVTVSKGDKMVRVYKNGAFANEKSGTAPSTPATTSDTVIGGEITRANMAFHGQYHALRVYNRTLSPEEIAHNAMVDVKRFFATLPVGYRENAGVIECNVKVSNPDTAKGALSVNGTAGDADLWVPMGETVKIVLAPVGANWISGWTGLATNWDYINWNRTELTFPVTGPMTLSPTYGTLTTYTYKYPTYVVTMAEGTSNSLKDVTSITKYASADAEGVPATYDEFKVATTGSLVKRGPGILTLDESLNDYGGEVQIEEGVAIACVSNALGSTGTDVKYTYIHNGATLVADTRGQIAKQDKKSYRYEGEGAPGMGGALVFRSGEVQTSSYWLWQASPRPTAPAKVYFDLRSGASANTTYGSDSNNNKCATDVKFEGKDMLLYGRTPGAKFYLNASTAYDIGHLVVSNLTVELAGNSASLAFKGTDPEIRFAAGSRYAITKFQSINKTEGNHTARFVVDGMEYMQLGRTDTTTNNGAYAYADMEQKKNWWHGPVVLKSNLYLYNSTTSIQGFTYEKKVSGPGGIRSWFSDGKNQGKKMFVNLMGTDSDFKGGIVLADSTLMVWRNGAVPAQEDAGLVSITNGTIAFCRQPEATAWETYQMPNTEFVGNGTVTNGTGRWRALVKKGAGTLDYDSQMGGGTLDLESGVVKFNTAYRANYEGEEGFVAALPAFDAIKGTAGTLDVANLAENYTVASLVDTPSISNANVTVTDGWTVSAAALAAGKVATFSGDLTFGDGATFAATDLDQLPTKAGGYVFARAKSVKGFPTYVGDKWCAEVDADGKTIRLKRNGLMIFLR